MIPLKVALPILCLAISFSIISSFYPPPATSQEEHPCLQFSDGKIAVVNSGYTDMYNQQWGCKGAHDTLAWLKSKGYHISAANINSIFLER